MLKKILTTLQKTQTNKTTFWQLLKGDRQQDRTKHKDKSLMGLARIGKDAPQQCDVEVFASCRFSPRDYLELAAQQSSHALIQ